VLFAQQTGGLLAPNGLSVNHVSNKKRLKRTIVPVADYKEMAAMNESFKKYAQFMSVSEYETLIENLRRQKQLCKRLQELHYCRASCGLTKLSEAAALRADSGKKGLLVPFGGARKRKRKSYHLWAESPNKRMTRRQNVASNSVLENGGKVEATLNETNLSELNISNIRNFSPGSSRGSSRSSSRSRSSHVSAFVSCFALKLGVSKVGSMLLKNLLFHGMKLWVNNDVLSLRPEKHSFFSFL
jgi:hypothetical protein